MRRWVVVVAVALLGLAVGCGKNHDGGAGSLPPPDAIGPGRHAFNIVAVLQGAGHVGVSDLPPANNFTLVLDGDTFQAIVGGDGYGAVVGITSGGGRTIRLASPFTVGTAGNPCSVAEYVVYSVLDVTISGDSLTGTASGSASVASGDVVSQVRFTATLTGTADTTAPLLHDFGAPPDSPFVPFRLVASEPLPTSAVARLVAGDGTSSIDLVQEIIDGPIPLVVGFSRPDVNLRAGESYTVALDGLVDFAGNADRTGPPLGLASFPAAPLMPEDGFESAAAGILGGAMVMTGGPLPAIAGNTSLYVGTPGAPFIDSANGRTLFVRLARQAGDTTLRLSFRVVASTPANLFFGSLTVGSEGASASKPQFTLDAPGMDETVVIAGTPISLSPVAQMEVPLPADSTEEVMVLIGLGDTVCGFQGLVDALLIDDLRLE